ncbi:MAG: hypothetical protein EPN31_10210 [Castellaniella sp.]|uniref:hypothetical protein n=1 Tax=Castellaniella sp. TaxID=1955812 RepID=UPI001203CBB6|nr:hypothetical protein [Castellaniella sp.]TAN27756.1 MAG: hypothetical protein EPN31_10210 [Castellaniella sp.]
MEASIAGAPVQPGPPLIRWNYLWYVAAVLLVMVAAILIGNAWFLNWVHVMSGVLWTGIDLFMGFVIGPIIRSVSVPIRKEIIIRLTPVTLFLMPTLSITTGTAGWFLAVQLGLTQMPWPQLGWIVAALVLVTLMAIQGLGYLLPTSVRVCLELQKPQPDGPRIGRMMSRFYYVVASQGVMQIAIIVVMARLVTGV